MTASRLYRFRNHERQSSGLREMRNVGCKVYKEFRNTIFSNVSFENLQHEKKIISALLLRCMNAVGPPFQNQLPSLPLE